MTTAPPEGVASLRSSGLAFELNRAGLELCVSPGAMRHQVKALEDLWGASLFRRLPLGSALTDEGLALMPVV